MTLPSFGLLAAARAAGRCWSVGLLSAALIAPAFGHAGLAADTDEAPAEPAAPQVQERDVRSLTEETPVRRWKEGDPVRVVPDLREDGDPGTDEEQRAEQPPKPTVRPPVAPQVMERSIDELPKVEPYREGEPVRVVPDLRESDPTD